MCTLVMQGSAPKANELGGGGYRRPVLAVGRGVDLQHVAAPEAQYNTQGCIDHGHCAAGALWYMICRLIHSRPLTERGQRGLLPL